MANVVDRNFTGTAPVGSGPVSLLRSVNTPDYPAVDWIIGPDLSTLTLASRYWKLVGDTVQDMTPAEVAAVQAADAAADAANLPGALTISRIVATPADLPLPPPAQGMFVGVQNTGAGSVGLAISGGARWFLFESDSVVGP